MNTTYSTPNAPENPDASVNDTLNSRWRYFRSLGGAMLLACFDSAPVEENPYFIEIDRIEYEHLLKELES
jgi:hypothetical protein